MIWILNLNSSRNIKKERGLWATLREETNIIIYFMRMVLHLIKLEFPSIKDALCQVGLKYA